MTNAPAGIELSVVICTCGRIPGLTLVLAGLAACQGAERAVWEAIVVDNCPSANTESAVRSFESRLPVRYVPEPRPGLSNARNRGVVASKGETIWFLDDDLKLSEGWLEAVLSACRAFPSKSYFGGKLVADFGGMDRPSWLQAGAEKRWNDCCLVADYGLGPVTRPFRADEMALGANMGYRRELFGAFGGFRVDLGLQPGRRMVGEELEFQARIREQGAQGFYLPDAMAWHVYQPGHMSFRHALRTAYNMGRFAQARKALYHARRGLHGAGYRVREVASGTMRLLSHALGALSLGWFAGARARAWHWMNASRSAGRFAEAFAGRPDLGMDWPEEFREMKGEGVPEDRL